MQYFNQVAMRSNAHRSYAAARMAFILRQRRIDRGEETSEGLENEAHELWALFWRLNTYRINQPPHSSP